VSSGGVFLIISYQHKLNLHHRHLERMGTCPTCGCKDETIFHALVECEPALLLWLRLKEMFQVKLPNLHPATWANDLINPKFCNEASVSVILCGMRSLWRSQNDLKHGKKAIPMKKAIDWTNLLTDSTRTKKQSIRNNIRWSPPPPG
jgi:hypothetical protein